MLELLVGVSLILFPDAPLIRLITRLVSRICTFIKLIIVFCKHFHYFVVFLVCMRACLFWYKNTVSDLSNCFFFILPYACRVLAHANSELYSWVLFFRSSTIRLDTDFSLFVFRKSVAVILIAHCVLVKNTDRSHKKEENERYIVMIKHHNIQPFIFRRRKCLSTC